MSRTFPPVPSAVRPVARTPMVGETRRAPHPGRPREEPERAGGLRRLAVRRRRERAVIAQHRPFTHGVSLDRLEKPLACDVPRPC